MAKPTAGELIPAFESTTQEGVPFCSKELIGTRTVLYFYPKDNTSGCTLEAQSLRDGRERSASGASASWASAPTA